MMTVLIRTFLTLFFLQQIAGYLHEFYLQQTCRSNRLDLEFLKVVAGLVKLTDHDELYDHYLDCSLTIRARGGSQLMIRILHLDIERSKSCKSDHLRIIDGTTNDNKSLEGIDMQWVNGFICGTQTFDKTYISTSNHVTINFTSDGSTSYTGFTIMFTPFHLGDCNVNEFKCENERCIHYSLKCNDYNNCGDRSNLCVVDISNIVIAVSVVVVLVLIVLIIFTINCTSVFRIVHIKTKSKFHDGNEIALTENTRSAQTVTLEKTECSGFSEEAGSAPLVENEQAMM